MSNDNDKQLFTAVLQRGLYMSHTQPVGTTKRSPRWEVVDMGGNVRGRGPDKKTALDAAWPKLRN